MKNTEVTFVECFCLRFGKARHMKTLSLDNRGLPPPEPMVRILEAVQPLESGDELHVLMDREPLLLYPELERRGFAWEFSEKDEDFLLIVRRAV